MKLLTWLDIRRVLRGKFFPQKPLPILYVRCYWDSIDVYLKDAKDIPAAETIFREVFGSWYQTIQNSPNSQILLDMNDKAIPLNFVIEEIERAQKGILRPFWEEVAYIPTTIADEDAYLPKMWPSGPSVIVFHSFKGGVGRTTHLAGYLLSMIEQSHLSGQKRSFLVVDADIEAPGLTVWEQKRTPELPVSFIDFLEMAQYDMSPNASEAISYTARELSKSANVYGNSTLFVLPAYRYQEQILDWPVKPEHIVKGEAGPWALADYIHELGSQLSVDCVLIDLRAGVSELSASLLLDPRTQKFLVTTLAEQSLHGVEMVVKQMGKMAPPRSWLEGGGGTDPRVLISMLQPDEVSGDSLESAQVRLISAYPDRIDATEDDATPPRIEILGTEFAQELLHIDSWDDLFKRLPGTNLHKSMKSFVEQDSNMVVSTSQVESKTSHPGTRALAEYCSKFEYAESGEGEDILITAGLRKLAQSFQNKLPNVVIIGSKGAGKTFTYIQLSRLKTWENFIVKALSTDVVSTKEAVFFPILEPVSHMREQATSVTQAAREHVWDNLGGNKNHWDLREFIKLIQDKTTKAQDWSEADWELFWLREISQALGFESENVKPDELDTALKNIGKNVVFLIDGLETTLQEIEDSPVQQKALRALLELPAIFGAMRDPSIGLIILIRKDLASTAIRQNFGQFADRYKEYALNWDFRESLQLVAWLCLNSRVIDVLSIDSILRLSTRELEQALHPIWGAKLGSQTANEARSSIWVYAALSDFNGRIQARDLVRFLIFAAQKSVTRSDRLLAPNAIRQSLQPCSDKKVEEALQEFPELKEIAAKFQHAGEDARHIPFIREELALTAEDVERLERIGIILNLDNKLYMPEIYRFGLKFKLEGGARPRVLALKKKFLGPIEAELR